MRRGMARHWLAALLLAVLTACKPSVEGETRAWDGHKLTLQEWSGKFPNFRSAIDGRLAEAQRDFDAALQIGDEEQRAAKMRQANDKVSVLTNLFAEIDRKVKQFDTLRRDPALRQVPPQVLMPSMQAADATMALARAKMDGPVANAGEAVGKLRDTSALLTRAIEPLQRAKDQAQQAKPKTPDGQGSAPPPGLPGNAGQPPTGDPSLAEPPPNLNPPGVPRMGGTTAPAAAPALQVRPGAGNLPTGVQLRNAAPVAPAAQQPPPAVAPLHP